MILNTLSQNILVLNPKLNVLSKNGKTTKHLIGINYLKNPIKYFRLNKKNLQLLEKIGFLYKE